MTQLSVVIPCLNAAETVAETLDAFAAETWSGAWEVIVVDNGSTDRSLSVVEAYTSVLPGLRIVDASSRRSQAFALNAGVQSANSESVAFCDADDVIAPGWVAAMGEALKRHDFVGCRVDAITMNRMPWMAALYDHPQSNGLQSLWYPPYSAHAGSGTLGVKKWVHDLVGGFDCSMPYVFDTEYCVRIQQKGVPLIFVPDATVRVRIRNSLRALFRQSRFWAEYNMNLYSRYKLAGDKERWRWGKYLRQWGRMARLTPRLYSPAVQGTMVWSLGWLLGLLKGSLKYGVPPASF